jgi:putative membrane protein
VCDSCVVDAVGTLMSSTREAAALRTDQAMIKNFTVHAANERTFLAWIRTALATGAAGFLIERFELFARTLPTGQLPSDADAWSLTAKIAGLSLILLAVLILALSTGRYIRFKREISSEEIREFTPSRVDVLFVALIGAVAIFMCVYVVRQTLG